MLALHMWLAVLVFVIGFIVEVACNASKHLLVSCIGWVLIFGAFVAALCIGM